MCEASHPLCVATAPVEVLNTAGCKESGRRPLEDARGLFFPQAFELRLALLGPDPDILDAIIALIIRLTGVGALRSRKATYRV